MVNITKLIYTFMFLEKKPNRKEDDVFGYKSMQNDIYNYIKIKTHKTSICFPRLKHDSG